MFTQEIINQKRNTPHDSMALVHRIKTVNVYSEPLVFILNCRLKMDNAADFFCVSPGR